jgi:hypothetical protein
MATYQQYLFEKAAWMRANPSATGQQIAQALKAMRQRLGV